MRFTGRARLIPDDDSTRCMTRSTAGTSWNRCRTQAQPGLAGSGRTPPVKGVGEPCAGEPHARFDGRGLETERTSVTAPAPDPTLLPLARSCPLACQSAPLTGTAGLKGLRTRQQVRVALGCAASQGDGATPRWPLRPGGAPPAHRLRVRQGPGARRRPHGPPRLPTPRYGGGLWPTARLTSATSNRAALVQGPARFEVASLLGRDHTAGCDACLRFSGSTGEAEPRELSYTTHRGLSDRPSSAVACS